MMSFLLLALLTLFAVNVHARWVKFDACGLEMPEHAKSARSERTIVAPFFGPYWVWEPSVAAVAGFTERELEKGSIDCTIIYLTGVQRLLVIGSLREVMAKLGVNTASQLGE